MEKLVELGMNEVTRQSNDVMAFFGCLQTDGFYHCYDKYDSLTSAWALVTFFAMYSFIFSIIGNNCSKVDQLWSITPVLFTWHFYWHDHRQHPAETHTRLLTMCILVTLWGVRLTYNFWRKGGYGNLIHHEEDYRWPILRKMMHPVLFLLFNFSFIAWYQNILLFLIAAPAYEVMKGDRELNQADWILVGLFSLLLLIESLADEQHFQFQKLKYSIAPGEREKHQNADIQRGFFTTGLFSFSRHPNYFAEQSMWVVIYLFSISHSYSSVLVNWTVSGCVQLILLFQGSMTFGESITLSKYPEYRFYQQVTSRCIPMPWPHAPLPAPTLNKNN
jgi:steroid 5-alpha reductase family enzyme